MLSPAGNPCARRRSHSARQVGSPGRAGFTAARSTSTATERRSNSTDSTIRHEFLICSRMPLTPVSDPSQISTRWPNFEVGTRHGGNTRGHDPPQSFDLFLVDRDRRAAVADNPLDPGGDQNGQSVSGREPAEQVSREKREFQFLHSIGPFPPGPVDRQKVLVPLMLEKARYGPFPPARRPNGEPLRTRGAVVHCSSEAIPGPRMGLARYRRFSPITTCRWLISPQIRC